MFSHFVAQIKRLLKVHREQGDISDFAQDLVVSQLRRGNERVADRHLCVAHIRLELEDIIPSNAVDFESFQTQLKQDEMRNGGRRKVSSIDLAETRKREGCKNDAAPHKHSGSDSATMSNTRNSQVSSASSFSFASPTVRQNSFKLRSQPSNFSVSTSSTGSNGSMEASSPRDIRPQLKDFPNAVNSPSDQAPGGGRGTNIGRNLLDQALTPRASKQQKSTRGAASPAAARRISPHTADKPTVPAKLNLGEHLDNEVLGDEQYFPAPLSSLRASTPSGQGFRAVRARSRSAADRDFSPEVFAAVTDQAQLNQKGKRLEFSPEKPRHNANSEKQSQQQRNQRRQGPQQPFRRATGRRGGVFAGIRKSPPGPSQRCTTSLSFEAVRRHM